MVTHRLFPALAVMALAAAPLASLGQTAPKAAAPKAAAPKAKAAPKAAGRFDARDPASLSGVLAEAKASAETLRKTDQEVILRVTTPVGGFGVQFVGCDANGKACKAMAFNTASQQRKASLDQINNFNQTSLTCRVYQDKTGKVNVTYSTLLSASDTRDELKTHVNVWQGCLADFGQFLNNPTAYLAAAP